VSNLVEVHTTETRDDLNGIIMERSPLEKSVALARVFHACMCTPTRVAKPHPAGFSYMHIEQC
jgi:hypothetical protein